MARLDTVAVAALLVAVSAAMHWTTRPDGSSAIGKARTLLRKSFHEAKDLYEIDFLGSVP